MGGTGMWDLVFCGAAGQHVLELDIAVAPEDSGPRISCRAFVAMLLPSSDIDIDS